MIYMLFVQSIFSKYDTHDLNNTEYNIVTNFELRQRKNFFHLRSL